MNRETGKQTKITEVNVSLFILLFTYPFLTFYFKTKYKPKNPSIHLFNVFIFHLFIYLFIFVITKDSTHDEGTQKTENLEKVWD